MASFRRPRHFARLGTALAGVALVLTACNTLPFFGNSTLKKLYVKGYTLNVDARLISGVSSQEFEDTKIANVRSLGNIGLVYSPNYIFVADPSLDIASTNPIVLPSDQLVEEPSGRFDDKNQPIMETVFRQPLYVINKTTLHYSVPGFTISDVTITQDIPIKSNDYTLTLTGVAQVNELMAAFAQDPAKVGSIAGSVTISCDVADMDPLAVDKTFVVARTFPLVYSYLPFTPETDISPQPSPVGFPSTFFITPTPGASSSPAVSPSPVASSSPATSTF